MQRKKNRIWFRGFFRDHPVRADGSHFFGARTSGKTKVYCVLCFESHLSQLRQSDDAAVTSGSMLQRRSDTVLQDLRKDKFQSSGLLLTHLSELVWTSVTNVMSSHSKTMSNHLLNCGLQSHDTKQLVEAHKEEYSDSTTRSPTRQRTLPLIPGLASGSSGLSSIPTPIPQLHVPDHPL